MGRTLRAGDLPAARGRLNHLCGRDPSTLDEPELARATVESVAENTSDAVVAPLFWGAVAGLPGLLGYRAANTLDAMVGHRSARYARFGTPAARLDDVLNLVPSRLTGLLTIAVAPVAHGRPAAGLAGVAAGPQRPPEPERRAVRVGDGRCARGPPRWAQRLLRALRGAAVPRRRPPPGGAAPAAGRPDLRRGRRCRGRAGRRRTP